MRLKGWEMYAEERRIHIYDLLKHAKRVDVADLSERFGASLETIRRDLREMEADGLLRRTHGGAIIMDKPKTEVDMPVVFRKTINSDLKDEIARVAAGHVHDGDIVALDNSTTSLCILKFIPTDFKLTLVTNSIQSVIEAMSINDRDWSCICLGGMVNHRSYSTFGFIASNSLSFFRPNILFMSCAGLDETGRLTEGSISGVEIKRELIRRSQKKVLLLDATKWGLVGGVAEADIEEMDLLITNESSERKKLEFLRDKRIEICFANGKTENRTTGPKQPE